MVYASIGLTNGVFRYIHLSPPTQYSPVINLRMVLAFLSQHHTGDSCWVACPLCLLFRTTAFQDTVPYTTAHREVLWSWAPHCTGFRCREHYKAGKIHSRLLLTGPAVNPHRFVSLEGWGREGSYHMGSNFLPGHDLVMSFQNPQRFPWKEGMLLFMCISSSSAYIGHSVLVFIPFSSLTGRTP